MKFENVLFSILVAIALALPVALAQENTTEAEPVLISASDVNETELDEDLGDPGITPDNPLYGLDRAIERIQLMLTFNKAEKAKMGLEHARERLSEVKAMVEQNKLNEAETAQEGHDSELAEVEAEIEGISEENATSEMEDVVALKDQVNEHRMLVERVDGALIKTKGNLTAEQQAMLDDLLSSIENTSLKLKVEVQNKAESTQLKIKVQTGKSDDEVNAIVAEIQETYQLENKGQSGVIQSHIQEKVKTGNNDTETETPEESSDQTDQSNVSNGKGNNK